jgi:hypothetical protein
MGNGHEFDNHVSPSMTNGATLNYGPMTFNQYQVCDYHVILQHFLPLCSNNSKSLNPLSALNQGPPLPVSSTIKHAPGLSAITRAEADLRSVPPPGDELTHLVEEAKFRKEVAKCHNTALVRYVDGYWMIPQPCKR